MENASGFGGIWSERLIRNGFLIFKSFIKICQKGLKKGTVI